MGLWGRANVRYEAHLFVIARGLHAKSSTHPAALALSSQTSVGKAGKQKKKWVVPPEFP